METGKIERSVSKEKDIGSEDFMISTRNFNKSYYGTTENNKTLRNFEKSFMMTTTISTKDSSKAGGNNSTLLKKGEKYMSSNFNNQSELESYSPRSKMYIKSLETSKAFHDTKKILKENIVKELG
jgi:hypothetical protein